MRQLISSALSATKEKNEDLDCEYEMIWDAEGSMHLVKKASEAPKVTRSGDTNPERFLLFHGYLFINFGVGISSNFEFMSIFVSGVVR